MSNVQLVFDFCTDSALAVLMLNSFLRPCCVLECGASLYSINQGFFMDTSNHELKSKLICYSLLIGEYTGSSLQRVKRCKRNCSF